MARDLSADLDTSEVEFEVPPHRPAGMGAFTERNAVTEMLKEERKKSTPQMWDESERKNLRSGNDLPIPTDKRNKASGFDRRLAFKGPYPGGYWIQNRKIFKGQQTVVSLSQIPEKWTDVRVPEGFEKTTIDLRDTIAFALYMFDQEILDGDPMRCKVCIEFKGRSDLDLMAHYRSKHPTELDQLVAGIEAMRKEEEDYVPPPVAAPAPKPKRQTFRGAGA